MANENSGSDFYVKFGSDAKQWGERLVGELDGARKAIGTVNQLLVNLETTANNRRQAVTRHLAAMASEADAVQQKLDSMAASGKSAGVDPSDSQIRAAAQDLAGYTSQLGEFMNRMSTLMTTIGQVGPEIKKAMERTNKSVGQVESGTTGGANVGARERYPAGTIQGQPHPITGELVHAIRSLDARAKGGGPHPQAGQPFAAGERLGGRAVTTGAAGAAPFDYGKKVAQAFTQEVNRAQTTTGAQPVTLANIPQNLISDAAIDRITRVMQDNVSATERVEEAVDQVARILNRGLKVEQRAHADAAEERTVTDTSKSRLTTPQNRELYGAFRPQLEEVRTTLGKEAYDNLWRKLVNAQSTAISQGKSIIPGGGAEEAGAAATAESTDRLSTKALERLKTKLNQATTEVGRLEAELGQLSEDSSEYLRVSNQLDAAVKKRQSAEQAYIQQETRAETAARQRRTSIREGQAAARQEISPEQRAYRESTLAQLALGSSKEALDAANLSKRQLMSLADTFTGQGYATPYRAVRPSGPQAGLTYSSRDELKEAILRSGQQYQAGGRHTADDLSLRRVTAQSKVDERVATLLNRTMRGFSDAASHWTRELGRLGLSPQKAQELINLSVSSGGEDPRRELDPRFITTSDIHDPGRTKGRLRVGAAIGDELRPHVEEAAEILRRQAAGEARAARVDVTEELRRNPAWNPHAEEQEIFGGIEGRGEDAKAARRTAAAMLRAVTAIDAVARHLHSLDDALKSAEQAQRRVAKAVDEYESMETAPSTEQTAEYTRNVERLNAANRLVEQRQAALNTARQTSGIEDPDFLLTPSYREHARRRAESEQVNAERREAEEAEWMKREEGRRALRGATYEYFGRAKTFGTDQGNTRDYFSRALPGVRTSGTKGREHLEFIDPDLVQGNAQAATRIRKMTAGLNGYIRNLEKLIFETAAGVKSEDELNKIRGEVSTGLRRLLGNYQAQFSQAATPDASLFLPPELGFDNDFLERAIASINEETGRVGDTDALAEITRQNQVADVADKRRTRLGELEQAYTDPKREEQFAKKRGQALGKRIEELGEEHRKARTELANYEKALSQATKDLKAAVKPKDKAEVSELSGELRRLQSAQNKIKDPDSQEFKDNAQAMSRVNSRLEEIYTATPGISEKLEARNAAQATRDNAKAKAEETKALRERVQAMRRVVIGQPTKGDVGKVREELTAQETRALAIEKNLEAKTRQLAETRAELADHEARRAAEREQTQGYVGPAEPGHDLLQDPELRAVAQEQLADLKKQLAQAEGDARVFEADDDREASDAAQTAAMRLRGQIGELEAMVGLSDRPIENRQGYMKGAISARVDEEEVALKKRLIADERSQDEVVRKLTDDLRAQRAAIEATRAALNDLASLRAAREANRGNKAEGVTGGDVEAAEKRLAEVTQRLAAARATQKRESDLYGKQIPTLAAKYGLAHGGQVAGPEQIRARSEGDWVSELETKRGMGKSGGQAIDQLMMSIGSHLRVADASTEQMAKALTSYQRSIAAATKKHPLDKDLVRDWLGAGHRSKIMGPGQDKWDPVRAAIAGAPRVDTTLYRGIGSAPPGAGQEFSQGLSSWTRDVGRATDFGKDILKLVGGGAQALEMPGGRGDEMVMDESRLRTVRSYQDPSDPSRTIHEVELLGKEARESADDIARLEREATELAATLARLKAQAAGGDGGAKPPASGGVAAADDEGGPPDKGILNKILLAIRQVNTTLKGGLRISGTAVQAGDDTVPRVSRAGGTPRSTPESRAEFEGQLAAINPALAQLVGQHDELAKGTGLVTRGILSETRVVELFRDKLREAGVAGKELREQTQAFAGQLGKAVGGERLKAAAGAAEDQAKKDLATEDDRLHQEAITRNKEFDRTERANAQRLKDEQREQRSAAAATLQHSAAMDKLSRETKREIADLAKMNAQVQAGTRSHEDLAAQMGKVYGLMAQDLAQGGVGGATATSQSATRVFQGAGIDVGAGEVDEARKSARSLGYRLDQAAADGAPPGGFFGQQSHLTKAMFGNTSFWSRVMASTGTFVVRNFAAGFVFGLTAALQQVISQAILTESTFIRVSDALEQTGRSAGSLRSDLQDISSDYGVALNDVYMTAAGLVGVFEDVGDIAGATRVVAQLQAISMGALNAQEAMGVLASITGAYADELKGGQEGLNQVADVLTVVQNVIGANVETTAEGVGALSGLAQQLKIPFAEMSVYVAQIAKLTNQTGAAAGEQFSRILAAMQGGRGRAALAEALPDAGIEEALAAGDYGVALQQLMKNWDNLSESQQRNLATTVAGQRQARAFAALMANTSHTLEATARAHAANGEAQARADAIARTLNGQLQRLMANFQNLAQNLVRTGLLNFFGVLLTVGNGVLSLINKIFSAFNDVADSNPFTSALKHWGVGLLGLALTLKLVGAAFRGFKATMAASGVTNLLGGGTGERAPGLRQSMIAAGPTMTGSLDRRALQYQVRAIQAAFDDKASNAHVRALNAQAAATRGASRAAGGLGRGLSALGSAGIGAQLGIVALLAVLTAAYGEWKARSEEAEKVRERAKDFSASGYLGPLAPDEGPEYVGPDTEALRQTAKRRSGFVSMMFDPSTYQAMADLATFDFAGAGENLGDHLGLQVSEEWAKEMEALNENINNSFRDLDSGASALRLAEEEDPDLAALLLPDSGKGSIRAYLDKVKITSEGVQRVSDELSYDIKSAREEVTRQLENDEIDEDEARVLFAQLEQQAARVNDQISAAMLIARGMEEINTLSMEQIKNIDQIRPLLQSIQGTGIGTEGRLGVGIESVIKGTGVSEDSKAGKIMAALGEGTMTHMEAMQKDYRLVRQEYTNLEAKYYAQIQGTGPSMAEEDFDALEQKFIASMTELAEKTDKLIQGFVEESTTIAQAAAVAGNYAGAAAALDRGLADIAAHRDRKSEAPDVRARRDLMISQTKQQRGEYRAQAMNSELQISQAYSMGSERDAQLEVQITKNYYNAMVAAGAPADTIRQAKIAWINAENAAAQAAQQANIAAMAAAVASKWNGIAIAQGQEAIALQQYNDAVANFGAGSAEALNALASYRQSQHTVTTTMDQVAQARRDAALAAIPQGNAVAVTRQTVANARAALAAARKYGQNSVEYQGALAQLYQAQQQARAATQAVAQAQIQVSIALADAAGHTVRSAVLQLRAARLAFAQARKNAGGAMSAEARQARAQAISAEAALRDARLQDALGNIDFNLEMGRMTQSAAISALQQILRTSDLTKQQRRDLMLRIKGMKDELAGDAMWNFGDIKMPKPYWMRRYIEQQKEANQRAVDEAVGIRTGTDVRYGQGGGGGAYHDNRQTNIHIHGGDLAQVRRVVREVVGTPGRTRTTQHRRR